MTYLWRINNMANLYELTGQVLELQNMLLDGEYEEQIINDTIESLAFEIEEKAENYAKVIKNIEADVEGYKKEEKRLADKRKSLENRIKYLKVNLENSMIALDKKKFKTQLFSFNIQKNAPSLKIDDAAVIPSIYLIPQEPIIDKNKLKDDVKNGLEIEGVRLEQSESLRIR